MFRHGGGHRLIRERGSGRECDGSAAFSVFPAGAVSRRSETVSATVETDGGRSKFIFGEKSLRSAGISLSPDSPSATPAMLQDRIVDVACAAQHDPELLAALGRAMMREGTTDAPPGMGLPAGYTYLLQFIAHDISRSPEEGTATLLTPALDLDGILGHPDGSNAPQGPQNGEDWEDYDSGVWLGPVVNIDETFFKDLPRDAQGKAQIPDRRNDQNLGVAQIHVLLTRFYHAVLHRLAGCCATEAKRITRNHFRWLVLHDVAPRIVDPLVWRDVMDNGPTIVPHGPDFLPTVEFTAACFRFGHSLPRSSYWWGMKDSPFPFNYLLQHTHADGAGWLLDTNGRKTLHDSALPNWPNLIFSAEMGGTNETRLIGEDVEEPLRKLERRLFCRNMHDDYPSTTPEGDDGTTINLGIQTLLWGHHVGLPSGQHLDEVVTLGLAAQDRPLPPPPLSEGQLLSGLHPELAGFLIGKGTGFLASAPLWFYVLREAALLGSGLRLGPLGSRIVMETLHAAAHVGAEDDGFARDGHIAFAPDPEIAGNGRPLTLSAILLFAEAHSKIER